MSEFLDTLKRGMQDAQVRFQAAQQKMAVFNAEFQAAAQEFQAWQTLVNLETAKEQRNAGTPAVSAQSTPSQAKVSMPSSIKSDGNKTEAVRELLRQHPAGMTPSEIWKELESQFPNRAYLYSVLKRLRDKSDARERRGKYFLNPKIEDNQGLVQ